MIQGKYDFGDHVFIDSKYTYNQEDVKYHELAHHAITQGSLYGVLEIALKQISIWYVPDIQDILVLILRILIYAKEL